MQVTYKDMPEKLARYEEFKGNSVEAVYDEHLNKYEVYSYNTRIYCNDGYFDNAYYSNTTSKLQNMLIDVFNLNNGIKKR
jgi:hypothetical protein